MLTEALQGAIYSLWHHRGWVEIWYQVLRSRSAVGTLTVAIVTRPFGFEGSKRGSFAIEGISELREHVNTLLITSNNLLEIM